MLKSFRYFLLPFSLIYWIVIIIRNWLFDKHILKSSAFNFPLICVGNLAVGGTGKTPMTEFIVRSIQDKYKLAIISRGYKRKTKGFAIANEQSTAVEIGDEPMQFHLKFPKVVVAVGEERLVAIPQLLYLHPELQTIILDDALQHRQVRAGLNILLTEYANLYTRDLMLPAGDLRDIRSSAVRADIIIVTKCSPDLSYKEKISMVDEISPLVKQTVYFTSIRYGNLYHLFSNQEKKLETNDQVLLVCGIANPKPLKDHLTEQVNYYEMLSFPDHHIFSSADLSDIKHHFQKVKGDRKLVVTTEKDAVRLKKFEEELKDFPIYVIPIEHHFLFEEASQFTKQVLDFIQTFKKMEPQSKFSEKN